MRRFLACLAPWTAVAAAWAQSAASLTVDFTYRGTYTDQGVRSDGACYVTSGLMRKLGWTVDVDNGVATVLAEGRTFQLESNIFGDRRLYCLDEALRYLGGVATWDEAAHKATVLGRVRNVEQTATGLRIDSTLSVRPRAFRASDPQRIVVDLAGAVLDPDKLAPLPAGWTASQLDPATVRVVVEGPFPPNLAVPALAEGRTVELSLSAPTLPPVQALVTLGVPKRSAETEDSVAIVIPLAGKASQRPTAIFLDPTTIQVAIPASGTDATGKVDVGESRYVAGVEVDDDKQGNCTVTVRLERALAFELSTNEVGVSLTLARPRATGGLAGKVIVVDPGHGGHDNGASHGGAQEKVQALAMAKTLAAALRAAGASIIMTRADDTFVPLKERPGMANRSRADLFISCHHNSNSVSGSRSGIIVFYHKADSMDMLLAECLRHEIAKEKQLPDMGSWSDGRIYQSGFAVLRGATMPAVLLELGFINHPTDRSKIQSQSFRDAIARAVVRGVKEFFGDAEKD